MFYIIHFCDLPNHVPSRTTLYVTHLFHCKHEVVALQPTKTRAELNLSTVLKIFVTKILSKSPTLSTSNKGSGTNKIENNKHSIWATN